MAIGAEKVKKLISRDLNEEAGRDVAARTPRKKSFCVEIGEDVRKLKQREFRAGTKKIKKGLIHQQEGGSQRSNVYKEIPVDADQNPDQKIVGRGHKGLSREGGSDHTGVCGSDIVRRQRTATSRKKNSTKS